MSSALSMKSGPLTAVKNWQGTDAQFQAALLDYIEMRGLQTTGTNQEKLDRVLDDVWGRIAADVKQHRKDKRMNEQRAALDQELATELPF